MTDFEKARDEVAEKETSGLAERYDGRYHPKLVGKSWFKEGADWAREWWQNYHDRSVKDLRESISRQHKVEEKLQAKVDKLAEAIERVIAWEREEGLGSADWSDVHEALKEFRGEE